MDVGEPSQELLEPETDSADLRDAARGLYARVSPNEPIRLRFRDARLCVRVEPEALEIRADQPTRIRLRGGTVVSLGPGLRRWIRSAQRWKELRP